MELCSREDCTGCSACVNICPKQCIIFDRDKEGFYYPQIGDECVQCGLCQKICPQMKSNKKDFVPIKAFVGFNADENVRKQSSSGGMFHAVAAEVLKQHGKVYGVEMRQKSCRVVYRGIDTIEELKLLQGSKYVESEKEGIFQEVEAALKKEKPVLFVGTPCIVAGLKSYLRIYYNNLITCDFICHGVPSGLAWDEYLKICKNRTNKKLNKVVFRDKENGWGQSSTRLIYDGISYVDKDNANIFIKGFLSNLYLRRSCYRCKYKRCYESDITLGDAWGIEKVHPDWYDDKGLSLVFANTAQGNNILKRVSRVELKELPLDIAQTMNAAYELSAANNLFREKFFKRLSEDNFAALVNLYCGNSLKYRIYRKAVQCIKRLAKDK